MTSAKLEWPLRRITVNLAPADLRKNGSGFDLPIAIAILAASGQIDATRLAGHAALGELALDGRVRSVPGTLAIAEAAHRAGLRRLICAEESAPEASLAGIEPVPITGSWRGLRVPLRPVPAAKRAETATWSRWIRRAGSC